MSQATIGKFEAKVIDADIYDAEIIAVEETVSTAYDNKPQYAVQFKISDPGGDFDGSLIRKWFNRFLDSEGEEIISQNSKLFGLLEVANPEGDLSLGTALSVQEMLLGHRVRISIGNKPTVDGKGKRSVVTDVLPAKKRKAAVPA